MSVLINEMHVCYVHAAMPEDKLTILALIHIHYQFHDDLDGVVDLFAELHPRRVQLSSVLLE